jgi:hypothetical protein
MTTMSTSSFVFNPTATSSGTSTTSAGVRASQTPNSANGRRALGVVGGERSGFVVSGVWGGLVLGVWGLAL